MSCHCSFQASSGIVGEPASVNAPSFSGMSKQPHPFWRLIQKRFSFPSRRQPTSGGSWHRTERSVLFQTTEGEGDLWVGLRPLPGSAVSYPSSRRNGWNNDYQERRGG